MVLRVNSVICTHSQLFLLEGLASSLSPTFPSPEPHRFSESLTPTTPTMTCNWSFYIKCELRMRPILHVSSFTFTAVSDSTTEEHEVQKGKGTCLRSHS